MEWQATRTTVAMVNEEWRVRRSELQLAEVQSCGEDGAAARTERRLGRRCGASEMVVWRSAACRYAARTERLETAAGGAGGSRERKWRRGAETPVLLAATRDGERGACLKATSFFFPRKSKHKAH